MNRQTRHPVRETDNQATAKMSGGADHGFEVALHKSLPGLRRPAPAGFADRIMTRIKERPRRAEAPSSMAFRHWVTPAAAGAAAAVLVMLGLWAVQGPPATQPAEAANVQFVFYAPGAQQVELVGDFTDWQAGRILLEGPDAAGRWTARVALPEGRHEYIFLVDGRTWLTDPMAQVQRPDGFGNLNAVMNL